MSAQGGASGGSGWGWYHARVSAYYVDAQGGRDRNAGRTADRAWKTLRRARRQALAPGDTLYLHRGRTWSEPLRLHGSGRRGLPITVKDYGDGPRPRIAVRGVTAVANDGPVSWWRIARLDVCGAVPRDPHELGGGPQGGIVLSQSTRSDSLLIEDCVVHDVAGPGIALWAGQSPDTVFADWTVADCEVYHAGTGITCGGPWPPGEDPWRFHQNFAVRDCRVHAIGTDGIVLSHCRGGVIEGCTAWRTGVGRTKRTPVGIWYFQALRCVIQYCESFDNHCAGGHADGGGFDVDGGAVDCTMQYNYSHDNDGAGYLICSYDPLNAPTSGCVTRYNLSVNDGRAHDYPAILYWQAVNCPTYNNTCITRVSSPLKFTSETWGHLIANNLFIVDGKADIPLVKSKFALDRNEFRNNLYWRTGGRARFEVQDRTRLDLRGFTAAVGGKGDRVADPRLTALAGREMAPRPGSPVNRTRPWLGHLGAGLGIGK